jgi:hypothetical protein
MSKRPVAVVDGANVAFIELSQQGEPKVSNLTAVQRELKERGYDPIVIVDAALRHRVDDAAQLESLIDNQTVRQAPAGTDADYFVVKMAEEMEGIIISNDQYKEYVSEHPWLEKRRVPLMIVRGQVELYVPNDEGVTPPPPAGRKETGHAEGGQAAQAH